MSRQILRRAVLRAAIAAGSASVVVIPGHALDTVTLQSEGINNDDRREALDARMRSVSLAAQVIDDDSVEEPSAQDLLGLALADYGRILSILYTEGYFGPTVSILVDGREAADIDPFRPPDEIDRIDIRVETGPRFRFGQADVGPRPQTAPPGPIVSGFQTGQVANSDLVGAAANAGVTEWRQEGHPKATVAGQSIRANHPERRLNVNVDLEPGPQLRFGPLTIGGTSEVSKRRVRQMMGYPEGEVYSPQELRDAVNRLRRTGVFSAVTVEEADTPNPDGTLSYSITLVDELKRRFGVSAEYSTLDGVALTGFWLHRNLFGGAERLRVDAQIANIGGTTTGLGDKGGIDYSLGFRATRPGTFGADNDLFFFGRYELTDDPDYREEVLQLGLGVSRYFSDTLYGEVAGALRYSEVSDAFGDRVFNHFTLPSNLEWDRRDNPGDPSRGFYLNADVTPYLGFNGSQSGMTSYLDGRVYRGLNATNSFIVAGRVQLGTTVGSDLDQTPPDFLFFSGGGNTVRGQPYQSLGVETDGGTSGGRSFLGSSLELRTKVTDSIGVVGFFDIGYVGADSFINADSSYQSGTGIGIRYDTPIGPIRADFATPVAGKRDSFSTIELYIGVGQAF